MSSKVEFVTAQKDVMGTKFLIKLPVQQKSLFVFCFQFLVDFEKKYSRFLDDSQLSALNNALFTWQEVDDEFFQLIHTAIEIGEQTDGAFDITLKEELERLGYDNEYSFIVKPKKKIPWYKKLFTKRPILLRPLTNEVYLRKTIDVGGLGKGYAMQLLANELKSRNVRDFYIDAGGDVYAQGIQEPRGWPVLLEHPDTEKKVLGKVMLRNQALACSAPNRRKWEDKHHLLNAKTGEPQQGLKAVFVLADSPLLADAYATALFTAGIEQAKEFSKLIPAQVLIITEDNKLFQTREFEITWFTPQQSTY